VQKPQWITLSVAVLLVFIVYFFGKTIPAKNINKQSNSSKQLATIDIATDSILLMAKKELTSS